MGGGIFADSNATVNLFNVRIEDNYGDTYAGGVRISGGQLTALNTAFLSNQAGYGGGAVAMAGDAYVELQNAIVAGNEAGTEGGGVLIDDANTILSGTNTIFYGNIAGSEGGGIDVNTGLIALQYCDTYGNIPDDYHGTSDPTGSNGNISLEPQLLYTAALNPMLWDLHLETGSNMVDAGAPFIYDPDLSASDMGIYGGPACDEFDLDLDGYLDWWHAGPYNAMDPLDGKDCDDLDPWVFPQGGFCP
jgi:predicted outer membrane repeat protein